MLCKTTCLLILNLDGLRSGLARAGSVEMVKSNVSISSCVFYGNLAEIGSALFAMQSTVMISKCMFVKNGVSRNDATIFCLGGAMYAYNSTVVAKLSTFQNNSANRITHSNGGAFALFASALLLWRSEFSNNVAEWGS